MKCMIRGCSGEYEARKIAWTGRPGGKDIVIVDGVPAEVCRVCGDTLLRLETVQRIEELLRAPGTPARTAPVLEFAA